MAFGWYDYFNSLWISGFGGAAAGAVSGALVGRSMEGALLGGLTGVVKAGVEGAIKLVLSSMESDKTLKDSAKASETPMVSFPSQNVAHVEDAQGGDPVPQPQVDRDRV